MPIRPRSPTAGKSATGLLLSMADAWGTVNRSELRKVSESCFAFLTLALQRRFSWPVVSANYRLGPFGFFAHPALTAESDHHSSEIHSFQNAGFQHHRWSGGR